MENRQFRREGDTSATSEEQFNIKSVIQTLQESVSKKDLQGVLKCFADDNVMFVLDPPLQTVTRHRSNNSENSPQKWFDTWKTDIQYYCRDLVVECSGDVGFAHCLTYMGGEKKDGEVVDLWFRETFGLKKDHDQWKISHHHQSVPMLMDGSGKAAVDLKPDSH